MISPTHTISPEWQNENALRGYPLEDDAPAAALIPAWLISDIRVTCAADYDTVYVSSVYVSPTLLSVGISGRIGSNPPVGLLTRTVTRDELEPSRTYAMDRLTATASGSISFGEPPPDAAPVKLSFSADEAPIVQAVIVRTEKAGVTRIVDPYHGTEATGIIDLSGNSEFRTSVDPDDPHTIVITLADMYRDLTTSVCDAVPSFATCGRTPVKTVNGVAPNDSGVIFLKFR